MKNQLASLLCAALFGALTCPAIAGSQQPEDRAKEPAKEGPASSKKPKLDHSGKAKKGKASYYAKSFAGKKMADGTPMNPNANIAASKTLPLGTKAEVVNLENGKSAKVEIRDRGPYVEGRIVDLSPKVADALDMRDDGVAPVLVKPIEVPQPDGSVKPGAGSDSAAQASKGKSE